MIPIDPNKKSKVEYLSKFLVIYKSKNYIKPKKSNKKGEFYKKYINLAIPAIPVNDVFTLITSDEDIKSFNNEFIYVNEIDYTLYFAGIINKEEVIQFIIDDNNYIMEGSNNDGDFIIIDNDKLVDKNCITFIHNIEKGRVKYKF